MTVILERMEGRKVTLRGRNDSERIILPWWPCSAATVRKHASSEVPRKWVDECAEFANDHLND